MKAFFLNIAALALFAAAAAATGILTTETILFQLAAQWLVNELWFDVCIIPTLLLQLFGRKGEGRDEAHLRRAARWTSICLLLLPALLYGLLALVESLTSNALGNWLGLPLGAELYSCSFAGFFLLFLLTLFAGARPLSVQAAFENVVDDALDRAKEDIQAAANTSNTTAAQPAPAQPETTRELTGVSCRHSRLYADHERDFERKRQAGEQLILATAPAAEVPMPGAMQSYLVGGGFGLAALVLLSNGYAFQQSGEMGSMVIWALCIMGTVFLLFALPLLLTPLRWRLRLNGVDYFITNRRLLIYCGNNVHIQAWNEPCVCQLTPRAGSCGDVAVIRKGRGYHILRTFFKRWAGLNEEQTRNSFDKGSFNNGKDWQTQALINVEGAEAIHTLITGMLEANERPRASS